MSAKMLLPNQHIPLHFFYGQNDCCLCREQSLVSDLRNKVASLESRLAEALERNAKLQDELGRSFDNNFGKYKTHHR